MYNIAESEILPNIIQWLLIPLITLKKNWW